MQKIAKTMSKYEAQ